jgi:hypothetical protein
LMVVSMDAADLQVVVANSGSSTAGIAAGGTAVDLVKLVDRDPPVLTLVGPAYMEVPEMGRWVDPGAAASDNVDGNAVRLRRRTQLCDRPPWLPDWSPGDVVPSAAGDPSNLQPMACGTAAFARVDTTWPTVGNSSAGRGRVFAITYTAKDAAGNEAAPVRRLVAVVPRCQAPERWCQQEVPTLAACSVQGMCATGLSDIGQGVNSIVYMQGATAVLTGVKDKAGTAAVGLDRTPPQLRLLGSGTPAVTPTGRQPLS